MGVDGKGKAKDIPSMAKLHPIKRYCDKHKKSLTWFAGEVTYTPQFISQLTLGSQRCGAPAARTIHSKFKEITIDELISWEPRQAA